MRLFLLVVVTVLVAVPLVSGKGKGFCPPSPRITGGLAKRSPAPLQAPSAEAKYAGAVILMAVISDKGYVCDVQLLNGVDKESNEAAMSTVRKGRFKPAMKNGRAIPVVVSLEVNLWRNAKGELIESSPNPAIHPPK